MFIYSEGQLLRIQSVVPIVVFHSGRKPEKITGSGSMKRLA